VKECTNDMYLCSDGKTCIHISQKCDGVKQCPNADDEIECNAFTCIRGFTKCKDNLQCISTELICDSKNVDCNDGSDEGKQCQFPSVYECQSGLLTCKKNVDRRCYRQDSLCDGHYECRDGSDEHTCSSAQCIGLSRKCADNTQCVRIDSIGDGDPYDCYDVSDELGIPLTACGQAFFACDKKCISKSLLCDGKKHCKDGTDEQNCPACPAPPSTEVCTDFCVHQNFPPNTVGFFGKYKATKRCPDTCVCNTCPFMSQKKCNRTCKSVEGNLYVDEHACIACKCSA
jgi:hypothetical protein